VLLTLLAQILGASPGAAGDARDPLLEKADWQRRYYALRVHEARLVKTIELATKEYADANRRNYRRSGVRHFHRTNANEAKVELANHRERIDLFREQLRASGGSIHWLDEIDEMPVDAPRLEGLGEYRRGGRFGGEGAYSVEPRPDALGSDPDDGRNPRFLRNEDGSDFRLERSESRYDFDEWRADREQYEGERAPERQLRRNDY